MSVTAENQGPPSFNLYGLPGLVDMPSGRMMPDGELAFNISYFAGITRATLAFQATPWLVGSFRYSSFENWNSEDFGTYYDRSFDIRARLLSETSYLPEISLGLQDFIGTGVYSGEYIVASKSFADRLDLTAGLGWGRFGTTNSIGSTGSRPEISSDSVGEGGTVDLDRMFRGDVGVFGGVSFKATDRLTLKAEYSSDAYEIESDDREIFDRKSPFNFGVDYEFAEDFHLAVYSMYGTEVGVNLQMSLNPNRPSIDGTTDPRPEPVLVRPSRRTSPEFYTTDWAGSQETRTVVRDQLAAALLADGLELEALDLGPTAATVYVRNARYNYSPQALGRTARSMSRTMPSSIDTFTIVPMDRGMAMPSVTYTRTEVETNAVAPDGAERMLASARVDPTPARPEAAEYVPDIYPRFAWEIGPYVRTSLFDPDNPFRWDLGVFARGNWTPAPGFLFSGTVTKKVVGNLDDIERESDSELPHVRSDFALYEKDGDPAINSLYGAYYFRPGNDLYARGTAGLLERMYAGVSTELLWAPYDRRYAFGAELNYAHQRDYNGGFGLLDYEIVTGHASAYWRFDDDFFGQIDAGRYLAGDYGATLSLQRVFANGWRVGAFATFTDVSAEEYGEGSFDKGITLTIPLGWAINRSTKSEADFTMRPLTRDGGQMLNVPGRLYDIVDENRAYRREEQWGRFWR